MMRSGLLFAAAYSASALAAQVADSTLVRKANAQLTDNRCKEALRTLAPLLERSPSAPEALFVRAKCRIWYTQELDAGLSDLQKALDQEPTNAAILSFRGDLYNDMHMFDRARADLDLAVANARDTADLVRALNRSAWNNLSMRRFDAARAESLQVLAIDSTDRGGLNNLALTARETNDTALAISTMKRIITVHPEERVGWLNLGYLMGTLGRHAEALGYYDHAETLGEKNAYFYNNRGYSRLGVGDAKGARQDVERALKMLPTNAYAYRNLALIELNENNTAAACTALEEALRYGYTKTYGNEVLDLRKAHCH